MARDDYRWLSVVAKQARDLDRQREPSVTCPSCETKTTAADLLRHLEERCTGPREPHPLSRWITWGQALALGASRATMHSWIGRGLVRSRGEVGDHRYLLRDLAIRLANRQNRRREFGPPNRRRTR